MEVKFGKADFKIKFEPQIKKLHFSKRHVCSTDGKAIKISNTLKKNRNF